MTGTHYTIAICTVVIAIAVMAVAEQTVPAPKAPAVACIEQRGDWLPGWGRPGWSGKCNFSDNKPAE